MNSITFFKNTSFTMNFTVKKHQFLLCFWKMGQSGTYVSSKTLVFTMNSAYFWEHVSKTLVFTMNSACFLPKTKPKHIFVQKHQFLHWIMHTFSKTSVFTVKKHHFQTCSAGCSRPAAGRLTAHRANTHRANIRKHNVKSFWIPRNSAGCRPVA